ncbi:unnamed protein product [Alopecurus aequalis]
MSTTRVLCKFSMHGACLEGESTQLSHDLSDRAKNVCTFYHRGACSNDSRFTHDHIKVSHNNPVFQHVGGGDVMPHHGMRSASDPHQAVMH